MVLIQQRMFGNMVIYITGINETANFRFLQRLSVIFGLGRDCPRSFASCRDYRPRKMASCRDCPCNSTLGRKLNHTHSLCRKPFTEHNRLGRKQEIADSLGGNQLWRTVSAGSENWQTRLYPVNMIDYDPLKRSANTIYQWDGPGSCQLQAHLAMPYHLYK